MVLVSRALYSRRIAEMVCTSHEAMAVAHSRGADEDEEDSPKHEHSSSDNSAAATNCACTRRNARANMK
ncbi:hypothetical protein Pmar_PMAR010316, partial [Perkinsus marinus ATCC 50983]